MSEVGTEAVVLRADGRAYRRWFAEPVRGLGALLGFVGVGVVSAFHRGDGLVLLVVLAVAVVGTLACIAIHVGTSRVTVTGDRIEYRRWGVRTTLSRDDLTGALAELVGATVGRTSQVLLLRARSGGPRIRLNGAYWDQSDLVRVAEAAGVPVVDRPMTPRDYEELAPGIMPFRQLHPWITGLSLGVVVVAVVVAGVFAWFDVKNIPPFDEQPPRAVSAAIVDDQDALAADLQGAVGGQWAPARARLLTCQDDDDYKGWSRSVQVALAETVADSGEDEIVTPVRPTAATIAAVDEVLARHGLPPTRDQK